MKLTEKQIKRIIKEELNKIVKESMGPDHPDYDYVGGIIMQTVRKFMHLAPMVKQGMGSMFENDIYHYVAEQSPEHADYITGRVMQILSES
tara:strand:- start:729 stop:1001 length:273 start_codon:yes stop_codon:yes gene_type:complete